jgi:hypothetical protein
MENDVAVTALAKKPHGGVCRFRLDVLGDFSPLWVDGGVEVFKHRCP